MPSIWLETSMARATIEAVNNLIKRAHNVPHRKLKLISSVFKNKFKHGLALFASMRDNG